MVVPPVALAGGPREELVAVHRENDRARRARGAGRRRVRHEEECDAHGAAGRSPRAARWSTLLGKRAPRAVRTRRQRENPSRCPTTDRGSGRRLVTDSSPRARSPRAGVKRRPRRTTRRASTLDVSTDRMSSTVRAAPPTSSSSPDSRAFRSRGTVGSLPISHFAPDLGSARGSRARRASPRPDPRVAPPPSLPPARTSERPRPLPLHPAASPLADPRPHPPSRRFPPSPGSIPSRTSTRSTPSSWSTSTPTRV